MYKRIFLIVLDSLGIGEMKDAYKFGDKDCNTLKNIITNHDVNMDNLTLLGMKELIGMDKGKKGYYFRSEELSNGKDTMTGHWEIMGLNIQEPFQVFTDTGFPEDLLEEIRKISKRNIVGNKSASGTEILDEFGPHQLETGDLIVYTSADSVLQIAAHEEVIPLEELYRICEEVRKLTLVDKWKVGRIIARPYLGEKNNFKRTSNRHDYALKPFNKTVLNFLKDENFDVISIGKINDIYDTEGITKALRTVSNSDGMEKIINLQNDDFTGLAFLNLVDFDALYGHRRDVAGYGDAISTFDKEFEVFLSNMKNDDLVIVTADHGNDPTAPGSDHTREYIPVLMYSPSMKGSSMLDDSNTFATIGATIADNFKVEMPEIGTSVLNKLK